MSREGQYWPPAPPSCFQRACSSPSCFRPRARPLDHQATANPTTTTARTIHQNIAGPPSTWGLQATPVSGRRRVTDVLATLDGIAASTLPDYVRRTR